MATTVILVRHGQTDWNKTERFRGRADVPLNPIGVAQARRASERIKQDWRPGAVYTSPLGRAVQTGEMIAGSLSLKTISLPGLIDIDFGEWEGLTPGEVQARWPDLYRRWVSAPAGVRIPGGETLEALQERGMAAARVAIGRHPDEAIVLVGHTHVNRAILLAVLGLDLNRFWKIRQDNAAINVFEADGEDFILTSLNETGHLSGIGH